MIELKELRTAERYLATEPLPGSFGAASISVLDIGEHGVQIEHSAPLRIGTRARLWFKHGDASVSTQATTVWSHMTKTPNESGRLVYHSGLCVDVGDGLAEALRTLADSGAVRRDLDSLERKRRRLLEREKEKSVKPQMTIIRNENEIPPDQALLVEHALNRLRSNPNEVARYSVQAKSSIPDSHASDTALAVWEYLERSIDLGTVERVLLR